MEIGIHTSFVREHTYILSRQTCVCRAVIQDDCSTTFVPETGRKPSHRYSHLYASHAAELRKNILTAESHRAYFITVVQCTQIVIFFDSWARNIMPGSSRRTATLFHRKLISPRTRDILWNFILWYGHSKVRKYFRPRLVSKCVQIYQVLQFRPPNRCGGEGTLSGPSHVPSVRKTKPTLIQRSIEPTAANSSDVRSPGASRCRSSGRPITADGPRSKTN
jgi:hypothetical protein